MSQNFAKKLALLVLILVPSVVVVNAHAIEKLSPAAFASSFEFTKLKSLKEIPRFLQISEVCHAPALELIEMLSQYHFEAAQSVKLNSKHEQSANEIYSQVRARLQQLESNGACFDDSARAYAVASVAFLESSFDQTLLKLALTYARDSDRVDILTSAKRQALGCSWTLPGESYDYKLYGGYFCSSRKISIDPYLRPLNLAASFIHELSHMVRDAFSPHSMTPSQLRAWTAYDEVLSTSFAAFHQIRLTTNLDRLIRLHFWIEDLGVPQSKKSGYQLGFDNNLFLRKGPMDKMSKIFQEKAITDPWTFALVSGLLPCQLKDYSESQLKGLWRQVFSNIYGAYFKSETPLDLRAPFLPFAPHPSYEKQCLAVDPILSFYYYTDVRTDYPLDPMTRLPSIVAQTEERLKSPTASCLAFQKAVRSPSPVLQDYVGRCETDPTTQGNEGGKTGNEGGKTSDEMGRPCLEIPEPSKRGASTKW